MNRIPSDNIIKLRELAEKLSTHTSDSDYLETLHSLKTEIDFSVDEVENTKTIKNKVKSYEHLVKRLNGILHSVNIF
jgi:CHASE3 domain sensor protein